MTSGGRKIPARLGQSRGVVSVEALICLPIILLALLSVVQLTLLWTARLVVHHAASAALRSALVVLDDDPSEYSNAPRGAATGARLTTIRQAAYGPLAALAHDLGALARNRTSLATALTAGALDALLTTRTFLPGAAVITLLGADNETPRESFEVDALLTVRVSYLMPCLVPLAARLICNAGSDIARRESSQPVGEVESRPLRALLLLAPTRYAVVEAHATGQNQGARYHTGGRS
jgi:hypothetical protein